MAKTSEQMREHNAQPKARKRRRLYMRSEKGKTANRKAQVTYRRSQPHKIRAQQSARSSGSGAGHHCHCGKPSTHKHHTDYGSGEIQWLCQQHHVKVHHPTSTLGKADDVKNANPSLTMSKSALEKVFEPQAKPGQTGKYVGDAPAKPVKPIRFVGRVDKAVKNGEPFQKPAGAVKTKADEAKWNRAKAAAKKQGQAGNYRLVMHIFQQMKKSEEQMETLARAMDARRDEQFTKAFVELVPKQFERELLSKALYDDDWHTRFSYTPFETQALRVEEDYQRACNELGKQHEANRKMRGAARTKMQKLVDKEAPYYDYYGKKSDLREKYTVKKRELLLKLLQHRRKEAEARKSLAKAENPGTLPELAKSQQEGPMSDPTLHSVYEEIRGLDVDQELAKAAACPKEKTGEPDPEKEDAEKASVAKGEIPMIGGAAGGANPGDGVQKSVEKAMSTMEHGEPGTPMGTPSSSGTIAGGGGASGGQEFNSEAKTGMPSNSSEYSTEEFSEDDVPVEQQLKEGEMKPLARTVPQGSADLGQEHTMNAPGEVHKAGEGPPGLGMSQAYANQIGASDLHGVGVGVRTPAEPMQKTETPIRSWGNGLAIYSDGEDQAIEKAQNEQGYITPEPTLGIPNSPLTTGCQCINDLCKAMMPSFITTCPDCGVDRASGGYAVPHGAVVMQKSVAASLRPASGDLSLPNGLILAPEKK